MTTRTLILLLALIAAAIIVLTGAASVAPAFAQEEDLPTCEDLETYYDDSDCKHEGEGEGSGSGIIFLIFIVAVIAAVVAIGGGLALLLRRDGYSRW